WMLPHSAGPAGSTLLVSIADTLAFALYHMLPGHGLEAMREPQLDLPAGRGTLTSVGLGWFIGEHAGERLVAHTGGSLGGHAILVLLPQRGVAVAAFVNSSAGPLVAEDLQRRLLEELT